MDGTGGWMEEWEETGWQVTEREYKCDGGVEPELKERSYGK